MQARIYATLVAAMAMAASTAHAHHSFATFDMKKTVTVTGEVKDFQWSNPHIWILVTVLGPNGAATDWSIEGGGPSVLAKQGLTKRALKAGDKITITMHPLKDGKPGGDFVNVVLEDGRKIGDTGGTG